MMSNVRPGRPSPQRNQVSQTVLAIVRILIASYFLAAATGLVIDPASRTFLDGVMLESHADLTVTIYLFVTAFLVMVGKLVRPAALMLAVYVFWSGFLHYDLNGSSADLSAFWRDMSLLGAVLLIALTEPGGSGKFRLFRGRIMPRRISGDGSTALVVTERRQAQSPQRNTPAKPALALTAFAAQKPAPAIGHDDDDGWNIFADIWDQAEPALSTA